MRRRILIVDDNTDSANSLAMILNLCGHEAEPVYGAAEALERAAALDPEIVLLDIGLPGIDIYIGQASERHTKRPPSM